MKPSLRLCKVLAAAACAPPDGAMLPGADNPNAETVTSWRVMPGDLDLFGHMNNSRYLMLMDFARVDYLARMGLLGRVVKHRWIVPVGTAQVDFFRPLKPFERFEIATKVLSWNDRWFYMQQTFRSRRRPGRTVATAYVKTIFRSPTGHVAPHDVVKMALGEHLDAPPLPEELHRKFGVTDPAPVPGGRLVALPA